MIRVEHLTKDYTDEGVTTRALSGVTLAVGKGEFVAIMGPSGSGKSTLLHMLSFLDRPTAGTYAFLGKKMDERSDTELAAIRNRAMGFVFQAFNLLGRSTVAENVELPLLYAQGVPPHTRPERVARAVEAVGLTPKIHTEAGRLSGGEKQRVAIARALVNDPAVIFADEPTGNLDSQSGAMVMNILRRLNDEGRTIILVTHETYTAEFAGRLIRLKDGTVASDEPMARHQAASVELFK